MAKFKVLKYSQAYMTRLGIYSNRLNEPTNEFFKTNWLSYYMPIMMSVGFTASVAFVLKYPTDIKPALGALKIGIAAAQCAGMFVGIGIKMIKVKALHLELQRIVDKGIFDHFYFSIFIISLHDFRHYIILLLLFLLLFP